MQTRQNDIDQTSILVAGASEPLFSTTLTLEKCMTVVRLLLLVIGVFNLAIGLKIVVTVFLHLNRDSGSKDQLIPEDRPMED
jgi:hypothetical protein